MKTNGYRRGSVLMEFIIVFPIYLVLFAGTVAVGDRLLHSNRLISADRVSAYRVDGHVRNGWTLSVWSGWDQVRDAMFHPLQEIADNSQSQDTLSESNTVRYADSTGPWSVCAVATVHDAYRPLAGGTLGQLLSAHAILGGGGTVTNTGFLSSIVDMVSKDTRNGASFYTLKRRDHYLQRMQRRTGTNEHIDPDEWNWRDRGYVSRLLRTQGGRQTENWRQEVQKERWHTADTISGGGGFTRCTEAYGTDIPPYERFGKFRDISD